MHESKQLSQALWPRKKNTNSAQILFFYVFLTLGWGGKWLQQSRQSCFSETYSRYTEREPRAMTHNVSKRYRWEGEGLRTDLRVKHRAASGDSVIDSSEFHCVFIWSFANDRRAQWAVWTLETVESLCNSQTANPAFVFIIGTVSRVMTKLKRQYGVAL